jgi:hypothetical protein
VGDRWFWGTLGLIVLSALVLVGMILLPFFWLEV